MDLKMFEAELVERQGKFGENDLEFFLSPVKDGAFDDAIYWVIEIINTDDGTVTYLGTPHTSGGPYTTTSDIFNALDNYLENFL